MGVRVSRVFRLGGRHVAIPRREPGSSRRESVDNLQLIMQSLFESERTQRFLGNLLLVPTADRSPQNDVLAERFDFETARLKMRIGVQIGIDRFAEAVGVVMS